MRHYRIVDSEVLLLGEIDEKVIEHLVKFETNVTGFLLNTSRCTIDFEYVFTSEEMLVKKRQYSNFDTTCESICYGIKHRSSDGEWSHILERENPLTEGFLLADDLWNRIKIIDDCRFHEKAEKLRWKRSFTEMRNKLDEDSEWIELFLTGFYSFATLHTTMMIHASAVKYQGKAILFTAPSGTGKTTQAELWREFAGAEILNGDRVFIKSKGDEERLYAWGSPWAGSSPYIVNDCAEVTAIVVLEQAPENSLRKMDVAEAMMHLSSNSFLPMWDVRCLEGMLGVMDLVLRKVPVYKLACRPDEGAVKLVRQELFG